METDERLAPGEGDIRLDRAMDLLRTVPAADPADWLRARECFLAEARRLAQEPVSAACVPRHTTWKTRLAAFLSIDWRERPMMALAKVLVVIAVLFGGGVGELVFDALAGQVGEGDRCDF